MGIYYVVAPDQPVTGDQCHHVVHHAFLSRCLHLVGVDGSLRQHQDEVCHYDGLRRMNSIEGQDINEGVVHLHPPWFNYHVD